MKIRTRSRLIKLSLLLIFCAAYYSFETLWIDALANKHFYNGWFMAALLVILASLNTRKKVSYLPLGRLYTWTQWHIYLGFLIAFLFLLHIDFSIPQGIYERSLALLFVLEIATGVWGLYLSRRRPKALTVCGENVIFERIPQHLDQIQQRVQDIVESTALENKSAAMIDFYQDRLLMFLQSPQDFWLHAIDSPRPKAFWQTQFQALHRYLSPEEQAAMEEIRALTFTKIDLDFQYSGQALLKRWLFLHIPLSVAIIITVILHVILAYSFMGSTL